MMSIINSMRKKVLIIPILKKIGGGGVDDKAQSVM
jgi:hypothetical protein